METLHFQNVPEARDPVLVLAFAGWNDAAESATGAARYLVERLGGERFAWIQPDTYFQYSDQRPLVRRDASGRRQIHWPANEFFFCRDLSRGRDLVVGIGVEPHLQWKRFSRDVLEVFRRLGGSMTVTLGALLAGELHTAPPRLVCLATDPALVEPLGIEISRYEGPTGIVGVIHNLMQDEAIPAVSLWANVPHYIASLQNPRASIALLDRFRALCGLPLDLGALERASERFDVLVQRVIEQDPRLRRFVTDLQEGRVPEEEEEEDEELDEEFRTEFPEEAAEAGEELPPGDQVADEIERLLRRRRGGPEKS